MDKKRGRDVRGGTISLNEDGGALELRVNLKELLNVSSDWKDVNNLRGDAHNNAGGHINLEF